MIWTFNSNILITNFWCAVGNTGKPNSLVKKSLCGIISALTGSETQMYRSDSGGRSSVSTRATKTWFERSQRQRRTFQLFHVGLSFRGTGMGGGSAASGGAGDAAGTAGAGGDAAAGTGVEAEADGDGVGSATGTSIQMLDMELTCRILFTFCEYRVSSRVSAMGGGGKRMAGRERWHAHRACSFRVGLPSSPASRSNSSTLPAGTSPATSETWGSVKSNEHCTRPTTELLQVETWRKRLPASLAASTPGGHVPNH
mmetsp:Transcript_3157/g.8551  ORF Transcript_3157/g.8551 Transcript_3157/m.8551 type:complete len:256 (+) Transcript_3157:1172-1939(+)